ncbi:MAG: universal stress protein [Dissulfurimicrobium sp.]|uniref:universal stress protein n=1 Tax=Dissulfurimicrobium hydrothermale TaxID=1750598 RepID=UPI001EDC6BE6|nr:universal stress protein [Dissulfurimicrobium hydrothermale]UKL14030.1 universal stress protein [Dissulfurimicrobium hydrothermale]
MLKKIIVAFDGSPQSYKAFDFALELARFCPGAGEGPEVTVISVAQPPELSEIVEMDAVIDNATRHYKGLHSELEKKAEEKGIQIETDILVGHPAEQIIRCASEKKADMLIMGQRGRSGISGWLMGSVSKRVTTYAPCTVTVVK